MTIVENWTQHLPFGPFKFMFFSDYSLKGIAYIHSYNKLDKIMPN